MYLNYFYELSWGDFVISNYNNLILKIIVGPIKFNNHKYSNIYILREKEKICVKYTAISGEEYLKAMKIITKENNLIKKRLLLTKSLKQLKIKGILKNT